MPRYVKDDIVIETAVASEGVELIAQGFRDQAARTKVVRQADAEKAADKS